MSKAVVTKSVLTLVLLLLAGEASLTAGRAKAEPVSARKSLSQTARALATQRALDLELERQEKEFLAERYFRQGKAFYLENRLSEAADEFREALKVLPDHRGAKSYLQKCLRAEEEAKQSVKRGRGKEPVPRARSPVENQLDIGFNYFQQGEYDRAIEELTKVLPLTEPLSADQLRARILINEAERLRMEKEQQEVKKARELSDARAFLEVDKQWLVPRRETKEIQRRERGPLEQKKILAEKAQQPVSFSFENAHLRDVVLDLSKMSGVNIVLDETIFTEGPWSRVAGGGMREIGEPGGGIVDRVISPLVTMSLEGIPLIEALDIILRSKGLRYRLESNLIYVSTPEGLSDEELITRVYHLKTGIAAVPEIELREWEKEYTSE